MRHFLRLFLAAATVLGARDLVAQNGQTPTGQLMLAPGDSIRIVVWTKPEFSGDFVVASDGGITHPLFREVKVANVPLVTAEANVRAYLERLFEKPQFVMEPLFLVSVSGEVPRPMVFAAQRETSIAAAVARAGGTQQDGDPRRVRVLRMDRNGAQRMFRVNLQDPADRLAQSPIHSGDQIVVDRRRSFLRDVFVPALGIVGSVASLGLLIDRMSRD